MADRNPNQQQQRPTRPNSVTSTFLHKLQSNTPNSTHFIGLLTLLISGSILLLLTGITVTASVFGFLFITPLIIISSPIWVPMGSIIFLALAGLLSVGGFGFALVGGFSWMYKYFRGMNPPGSNQVDYARTRIYDTASHVKDYAREYGGYLQSKVKDAAPGA